MGSRIVATIVVLAGVAALIWVAAGGGNTETAAELPVTTTSGATSSSASSSDGSSDPADTTDTDDDAHAAASAADVASDEDTDSPTQDVTPPATATIEEPENLGPRMDLVELDGWLNTNATSIDDFDGQVLLVEMWTFGCHNCKARIPHNQSYYEEFKDENFEIVGVHAPEFSYEADVANIENALVDLGVTWPVALDTSKKNFRSWQPGSTNFWPRTFVIDQNGDIRYDHIGEGKYEQLRETLRYLIDNPPATTSS